MTTALPERATKNGAKATPRARTKAKTLKASATRRNKARRTPREASPTPPNPAVREKVGQRVKRLMEAKGFNQTTLAKRTNIERTELNRLVNDKRQPRYDELAWLANALDVTVEVLLDGVELPDDIRKTLGQLEDAARRVLEAEGERDEVREKLKVLETEYAGDRKRWEEERKQLEARVKAALDEGTELRSQADAMAQALEKERRERGEERGAAESRFKQAEVSLGVLRNQVAALRRELAQERASKIATGVIAGLAGLFGGAALGSSSSGSGDDDDE
jgi:transcriptional regulator with XRE-family HTH domain